ncbi:MAG TPA: zf-HC2 domain-containing protein [Thermoanaerobaculia bacterium]|nr:zf-HC2 domain-containing protein [Thermoanaerobaculia bacterium]
MNPELMPPHTSIESLAAFIDGRLRGAERRRVEAHLASCAECRSDVNLVAEAQDAGVVQRPPSNVVEGRFGVRSAFGAIAAAVLIGVVLTPTSRERFAFYRTGGTSALVAASESLPEREIEARPMGGFPYKPLKPTVRSFGDDPQKDEKMFPMIAAARRIQANADSVKELRAAAIGHLFLGELDRAVATIERAVKLGDPDDAALLNDVATVYLERARRHDDDAATDIPRALDAAERSWALAKTPEAAWNRALAREMSGRDSAATAAAWRDYLALDPASPWADEARTP